MIINGDWSWTDYLTNPDIDAAVAVLPIVSATGLPMQSMIMPKGYSLNANASPEASAAAMAFVRHMTSPAVQRADRRRAADDSDAAIGVRRVARRRPTRRTASRRPRSNNTRLMPVATELRGVWDAMRPQYQAVLGGSTTPDAAAAAMQHDALEKIALMHRHVTPDRLGHRAAIASACCWWRVGSIWQRDNFAQFRRDWRRNQLAYLCVLPAAVIIFAVIIFPLCYNIVLSLSNMSLVHFRDWQIVGLQNYVEVFTDPKLGSVLVKTVVWTVVSVAFHLVDRVDAGGGAVPTDRGRSAVSVAADHSLGGARLHHGADLAGHVQLRIRRGQSDPAQDAAVSAARAGCWSCSTSPRRSIGSATRRTRSKPASRPTSGSAFRS